MDRNLLRQERVEQSLKWLSRYDPLVDDRPALHAAWQERAPVDLLIPLTASEPATVLALLASRGLAAERFSWAPDHLRVRAVEGAGTFPEVILGFAYPQGISSALPPRALAPQPGERLVDLCAAPGGKTLYLASLAGDRGRIVAADLIVGRTGPLVSTLARGAIASAVVTAGDSASLPQLGTIDAILLDAPCSGEGTFRIPSPRFEPRGEQQLALNPRGQRRLLERALDLLRPGGRLLYSTCAFAPEENEAVLADVIGQRDDITLVPLPTDFPGQPGIDGWNGRRFGLPFENTRRIFPHHTGSWGFFIAALCKSPESTRTARLKPQREARFRHDPEAERIARQLFEQEFGLPSEILDRFEIFARGRDLWLRRRLPPEVDDLALDRLRVVAPGLRAVHVTRTGPRPTTVAIRAFGGWFTRGVVELPYDAAVRALGGESVAPPSGLTRHPQGLRVAGKLVGTVTNEAGACRLHLPGGWR